MTNGEKVVDYLESLVAGREIDSGDVANGGELGSSVI